MRNRRGGKARCCDSASRCCVIGCQRQLYVDNAVAAITSYPSFPPRDYLPVCICSTFTRWKISNIAQRLASRAQVVREPTFLVAFRRLPSKNREFSTVVRRFSYSVWKGRRPASSGRVAFRARVVQCALVSHALGGFALKRFLCFRISSNTFRFDERKCFYFGGRNVKRVSRRSFNFFHVSLGKKRKQREKRKKHFPLPRAYRVLKISKRNNTKMLLGRDNPSPLRYAGSKVFDKYSGQRRVLAERIPARGSIPDPSLLQRRSIGDESRLEAIAPRCTSITRPPSIHATHLCLRLCTGAIYAAFMHSLLSPRPHIRDIRLPREYARHMDPHARTQPAHRLCKRCAPTVTPGPALYSRVRNLLINYRAAVTLHRSCIIMHAARREPERHSRINRPGTGASPTVTLPLASPPPRTARGSGEGGRKRGKGRRGEERREIVENPDNAREFEWESGEIDTSSHAR